MKLLYYILSLYTILLSCIPCQDEALEPASEVYAASIRAGQPAGDHAILDMCSPFCICACCAGITLQQVPAALPEATSSLIFQDRFDTYTTPGHGENLNSIWQPPRA